MKLIKISFVVTFLVLNFNLQLCHPSKVADTGLGDYCEEGSDTSWCDQIPNAGCHPNPENPNADPVCSCNPNYGAPPESQTCFLLATQLGDNCLENDFICSSISASCVQFGAQGRKECQCDFRTHIPNSNLTNCLKLTNELGADCEESKQCTAPNAKCSLVGKCECKRGWGVPPPEEPQVCHKLAEGIGQSCELGGFLCKSLKGSTCKDMGQGEKVCECDYETQIKSRDGQRCLEKIRDWETPCEESRQCEGQRTECRRNYDSGNKTCLCDSFSTPSKLLPDGDCVPLADWYNTTCTEMNQCKKSYLGKLSDCISGRCLCTEGSAVYWETGSPCYLKVELHQHCNDSGECWVGPGGINSICDNYKNQCSCKDQPNIFEYEGLCLEERGLLEDCVHDKECVTENAHCRWRDHGEDRLCYCKEGYDQKDWKCVKKEQGGNDNDKSGAGTAFYCSFGVILSFLILFLNSLA